MTFEQALYIAIHQGAQIRHPNMSPGYIFRIAEGGKGEDELESFNPFNGESSRRAWINDYDRARTDWIAGHGIAAL